MRPVWGANQNLRFNPVLYGRPQLSTRARSGSVFEQKGVQIALREELIFDLGPG
jgi:hypothetical protein